VLDPPPIPRPPDPVIVPLLAATPMDDGRNILEEIPREVCNKVLSYLDDDIPSLVELASTSKSYQTFVYQESQWLWKTIHFGKINFQAYKLTDFTLHALLTNVNARKVTIFLSLMGCSRIEGYGLGPVMYSRCLEVIDLQLMPEDDPLHAVGPFNDDFVISVLSTMAPLSGTNHGPSGPKVYCLSLVLDPFQTASRPSTRDSNQPFQTSLHSNEFHVHTAAQQSSRKWELFPRQLARLFARSAITLHA